MGIQFYIHSISRCSYQIFEYHFERYGDCLIAISIRFGGCKRLCCNAPSFVGIYLYAHAIDFYLVTPEEIDIATSDHYISLISFILSTYAKDALLSSLFPYLQVLISSSIDLICSIIQ